MKIHLLSGFLGSGKTTAIQQAANILIQRAVKTGIITNDQGTKLVDGGFFKNLDIPGREVINGCFCCNYNSLDASITSLIETNSTEVIFAESVGSCTDIVATVLKPLLQFRPDTQTTVSTFADVRLLQMMLTGKTASFDETVRYIYFKQLEEAGIIVINKIDLINDEQLFFVKECMKEKYGDKILLYQNSISTESIQQWLKVLDDTTMFPGLSSLIIDYDIYAAGEAKLAWVDQVFEIYSSNNNALQEAEYFINKIFEAVKEANYPIGHLKFLLNNSIKISFVSAADLPVPVTTKPANTASLLINMRVQTAPEIVTQLIANVIKETEAQTGCSISSNSLSAFQPGYPKPAYRM